MLKVIIVHISLVTSWITVKPQQFARKSDHLGYQMLQNFDNMLKQLGRQYKNMTDRECDQQQHHMARTKVIVVALATLRN